MSGSEGDEAVGFRYWPFNVVPDQNAPVAWAARAALKAEVDLLKKRLSRNDAVSLNLLWADFGAGKTHTLLYFKQEAELRAGGVLLPIYSALPKGCRSFIDIYRAIVRAIPQKQIAAAYETARRSLGEEILHQKLDEIWQSLSHCFKAISIGNEEQRSAAVAWFQGETGIPGKTLQSLSIFGRIKSADEAVLCLTGLVRLLNLAGSKRVVLMVDEFQRVQTLRDQQLDEINAGLHSFYNNCSRGMSLILSFSFGEEENIKHFLNPELLSRADPLRISIPAMTVAEANEFLEEVVQQAREPDGPWPVTKDFIPAIVQAVQSRLKLTPRRLIKAAGLAFELGTFELETNRRSELSQLYIEELEKMGRFDRIDEEVEN